MDYRNCYVFTPEKGFVFGGFSVEGERFGAVFFGKRDTGVDLGGAYVLPGLVDVHIHGAAGADFSDGNTAGLSRMAAHLAKNGVTSFAPTSMTLPYDTLKTAFQTAATLRQNRPPHCARVLGVHMEGPFFSEQKKGAQNAAYLRLPDAAAVRRLCDACGCLKLVDVAPELAGAADFTREVSAFCRVSVAHTDATYDEAKAVYDAGALHLTHLYNAMPPFLHRAPGVIGAASECNHVTAELICDGQHVHPSAVRAAFRLFPGRVCLISDALRCCGMPDGEYDLAGQRVTLRQGVARLADGTIAGAASNLFQDLQNAVSFGVPLRDAVLAATLIPAKALSCDAEVGSIAPGKFADAVLCDEKLNLRRVMLGGAWLEWEDAS